MDGKESFFGLSIVRGATGYVVYENPESRFVGKVWAFETPESLGQFIIDWADKKDDSDGRG